MELLFPVVLRDAVCFPVGLTLFDALAFPGFVVVFDALVRMAGARFTDFFAAFFAVCLPVFFATFFAALFAGFLANDLPGLPEALFTVFFTLFFAAFFTALPAAFLTGRAPARRAGLDDFLPFAGVILRAFAFVFAGMGFLRALLGTCNMNTAQ
ncbi:MAG: hypothetical protein K8I27_04340 [Planctomycetes bacterium]|nr:hypothetical protein [Planctomycetota bacterium]